MAERVKQPVRGKRARVPVVMQMEALECGAASLAMVMAYYGKWVPLEQVRLDCGVSRDGSNAKNVLVAARSYGFDAKGFRCEVGAVKTDMSYPCIIHWNFNHFVVLDGFRGDYAYLNDPARGEVRVSMEEFDRSFTGICCMSRTPTESSFKKGSVRHSPRTRTRMPFLICEICSFTRARSSSVGGSGVSPMPRRRIRY